MPNPRGALQTTLLSDDHTTERHLVYAKFGLEMLLPMRRLEEDDEHPNAEPATVINTEPVLGPLHGNEDAIRGCGGACTLRKTTVALGKETETKLAPSKNLEGALQVILVSECQKDALQVEVSSWEAMDNDWRPK